MGRALKLRDWLVVGALGFLAWQVYGCEQRRHGANESEIRRLKEKVQVGESAIALLLKRKAQVDTVKLRGKTVYLAAKAKADSNPTPENRDAEAKACSVVLLSCEEQVANRDYIIASLTGTVAVQDSIITALERRKSSRFGCAAGAAATTKGAGLGAACGIRFP